MDDFKPDDFNLDDNYNEFDLSNQVETSFTAEDSAWIKESVDDLCRNTS